MNWASRAGGVRWPLSWAAGGLACMMMERKHVRETRTWKIERLAREAWIDERGWVHGVGRKWAGWGAGRGVAAEEGVPVKPTDTVPSLGRFG